MITKLLQGQDRLRVCAWTAAFAVVATAAAAQTPAPRIRSEVNNSVVTKLSAKQQPLAQMQYDAGRMPANTKLTGMSIVFSRSAAQEASLKALLVAQQDPTSPLYHQWLNPDQFAAQFGMAQTDIDKVQSWLQQQGFSIDSVARSKNMIRFSGTARQVEQAFQTEMHYYGTNGEKHFGPSTLLSVPAAIAPTIEAVRNVSDFKPRAMHISARRAFTSGQSGNVFFAPGDIGVTYDVSSLWSSGVNGTGQAIAIVGQSEIEASDIENFQTAAGLAIKDPVLVIVPGSGTAATSAGDESESDLDLEWSGAMAPGATIDFVFTGNNTNYSVWDSIAYAIDEKIAPIISSSYGVCEAELAGFSLESNFEQAASQGQTVLSASGDSGSTACQGYTGLTTAQQQALAVNYPASSPNVLGVGGTEITAADIYGGADFSTYWSSNGTNDVLTSAKSYIPEVAWNDDTISGTVDAADGGGLSSSGGGVSTLFAQPTYQSSYFTSTGEKNPDSSWRLVPDVALYASPEYPGYLYCTSDESAWQPASPGYPAQAASCSNGTFRDEVSGEGYLTVAGGTSFATPIFAGFIALINQQQQWTSGQGLAATTLYKLAANSATYGSAFHDVTTGNNYCTAGTTYGYCSSSGGSEGYAAGTGYDMVTGLGSVDVANLLGAWPVNSSPLTATTTTLSATTTAPNTGQNDTITITVASATGSSTPTGTVNLSIDGGGTSYSNSGSTTSVTLSSNGTATYTANFTTAGVHTIVAQYAGDTTFALSTGSIVLNVAGTSSGKGSFTMGFNPASLTVSQGSSGTEALTVTPSGGYTGTVNLAYDTSNDTALENLCVEAGTNITQAGAIVVSGSSAVTGNIVIDTNASDCTTAALKRGHGNLRVIPRAHGSRASNDAPKKSNPLPAGIALAGLLIAGFLGRSSRKLRQLACVVALASLGLAISACGGGSSSSSTTVPNPAKGTYTITFTGEDSTTSSITSSASFQLVID